MNEIPFTTYELHLLENDVTHFVIISGTFTCRAIPLWEVVWWWWRIIKMTR